MPIDLQNEGTSQPKRTSAGRYTSKLVRLSIGFVEVTSPASGRPVFVYFVAVRPILAYFDRRDLTVYGRSVASWWVFMLKTISCQT